MLNGEVGPLPVSHYLTHEPKHPVVLSASVLRRSRTSTAGKYRRMIRSMVSGPLLMMIKIPKISVI